MLALVTVASILIDVVFDINCSLVTCHKILRLENSFQSEPVKFVNKEGLMMKGPSILESQTRVASYTDKEHKTLPPHIRRVCMKSTFVVIKEFYFLETYHKQLRKFVRTAPPKMRLKKLAVLLSTCKKNAIKLISIKVRTENVECILRSVAGLMLSRCWHSTNWQAVLWILFSKHRGITQKQNNCMPLPFEASSWSPVSLCRVLVLKVAARHSQRI